MHHNNPSFTAIFNRRRLLIVFFFVSGIEGGLFALYLVSFFSIFGSHLTKTQLFTFLVISILSITFLGIAFFLLLNKRWKSAGFHRVKEQSTVYLIIIVMIFLLCTLVFFVLPGLSYAAYMYWLSLAAIFLYLMLVAAQALFVYGLIIYGKTVESFILKPFSKLNTTSFVKINKWYIASFTLITILYIGFSIYRLLQSYSPVLSGDSVDYLYMAGIPIKRFNLFFTNIRPWTVSLIYKLLPKSEDLLPIFQTTLWAFSWGILAFVFARSLKPAWFQPLAYTIVLVFSLTTPIIMWNHVVLSESISISLFAFLIALWMTLLKKWDFRILATIIIVTFFWQNTRETIIYFMILLTSLLVFIAITTPKLRPFLVVSAFFTLFIIYGLTNSNRAYRYRFPMINIIGRRILTVERYKDYFVEHGMPVNETLLSLTGGWANSQDFAFFNDPSLRKFRRWLDDSGMKTYAQFLINHPEYTVLGPLKASNQMLSGDLSEYASDSLNTFPYIIDEIFYPYRQTALYLFSGFVCMLGWSITQPWKRTNLYWVPLILVIIAIPYGFVVWIGDEMEISRHAILFSILLRLGILLSFILISSDLLSFLTRLKPTGETDPI